MAMSYIDHAGERVIIEADSVIDLVRGRRRGVFLGRARSLTAAFVRPEANDVPFLVSATSENEALDKIAEAVKNGQLVRRPPSMPRLAKA